MPDLSPEDLIGMIEGKRIEKVQYAIEKDTVWPGSRKVLIREITLEGGYTLDLHGVHDDVYLDFIWESDGTDAYAVQYHTRQAT